MTQNEAKVSVGVYQRGELSSKLLGKDFASMINPELATGVGTLEPVAGAGWVKDTSVVVKVTMWAPEMAYVSKGNPG